MPASRQYGITNAQRRALRQHSRANPHLKQKALQAWFSEQYNRPVSQPSISECLSSKYACLDADDIGQHPDHAQRGRKPKYDELDKALYQWYQRNGPVNGDTIKSQALVFWRTIPAYLGMEPPHFSNGWLDKFRKRHNIKVRKRDRREVEDHIKTLASQYAPADVYACDETGLLYKALPDSLTRTSQQRMVLQFCTNADGSHKVPLWFVGQSDSPFANITLNCAWRQNTAASMTSIIMLEWLHWFSEQVGGRKVLLIMDSLSAHTVAAKQLSQQYSNINIAFLPRSKPIQPTTSQPPGQPSEPTSSSLPSTSPLEQGIFRNFKALWKRRWIEYLQDEAEADRRPLETMTELKAVRWSIQSWNNIAVSTIKNCWAKSGIVEGFDALNSITGFENVEADLIEGMWSLQQQQIIQATMTLDQLLESPDEQISVQDGDEAREISHEEALENLEILRLWQLQHGEDRAFIAAIDNKIAKVLQEMV